MPIYDYLCTECGTHYDIFHKTREVVQDVVCPACHSTNHRRLMSVPAATITGSSTPSAEACRTESAGGGCCGGMCSVN